MQIVTTYPLWYLLFCILVGAGVSFLLYYRSKQLKDFSTFWVVVLSTLRFLAVALLCFFLLEPMLKLVRQELEKPLIVVGVDNSTSMLMTGDSTVTKTQLTDGVSLIQEQLGSDFDVRSYSFGSALNEDPELNFSEKETDISSFIDEVHNRYSNRNLGAVVIATDGIYNRGINPVHQTRKLRSPIYTIAVGDTTAQRDLLIKEVVHNELAYLGNDFPVEVMVEATGFSGSNSYLSVRKNGVEIVGERVNIDRNQFQQAFRFLLETKALGIQRYSIHLEPIDGEFTEDNNHREFFIEVLDSKQKVLLAANAPHPDIRALRLAIESNENYELDVFIEADASPSLADYHLVILHGLPSKRKPYTNWLQTVREENIPAWFILTGQTDIAAFNEAEVGLVVTDSRSSNNSAGSGFNSTFSLFNIDAEQGNYFGTLPPLSVPFGEFNLTTQGQTLMHQRIGSVRTEFPLWVFCNHDDRKTAVLAGEGIWRWRTMSYADKGSHELFNTVVNKTVQYLASRENKAFLRVKGARSFKENERLIFRAECYNQSYELYTEPDVQMVITDSDDRKYEFQFSRTGNSYRLDAGNLPVGNYNYRVSATGDNVQHEVNGSFSVTEVNIESMNVVANHRALSQLARETGGQMLMPASIDQLPELLRNSSDIASVVYERKELADLINLRWIFFVLLALFAIEWFVRKRNGAY